MKIYSLTGFPSALTGSFTGSFVGDGSGLSGTDSGSWDGDFVGSAKIIGSLSLSGSFKDQESSPGTAGQVLSSTVSGSQWVDAAASGAITGTGTTGTITKWTTGGSVIGDSIIAESASTITVNGVGKFTGNILALANIGVGMTPDTSWGSNSHIINLGIANADAGHIGWREQGGADELSIGWNVYHNNTDWYYASSNPANLYTQISSGHVFKVAASGTEDNAISWINALSISSTGNTAFVGNVGIGISSPSVKLDVGGASNSDSIARFAKTSEGTLLLGGNVGPSNCPFIGSENNFDFAFITNNTEKMRISSGGNVKIGNGSTATPSANANDLFIDKGAAESGITILSTAASSLRFGDASNVSIGSIEYNHNSDYMRMIVNNSEAMRISSGGDVNIGTSDGLPLMHGSVAGNSNYCTYSFVGDPNTGMIRTGADALALVTAGSTKLTISSVGAIGIDNSSPDSFSGSGSTSSSLVIGKGTNSISPQLTLWQGNSAQATINFASSNSGTGQYEGRIRYTKDTGVMDFRVNAINALTISSVGKLTVASSTSEFKGLFENTNTTGGQHCYLDIKSNGQSNGLAILRFIANGTTCAIYNDNNQLKFNTNNVTRLTISNDGKLYYAFTSSGGSVNDVTFNPSTNEVYYISSSRRYKENIKDYSKSTLDNILKLKVKTFDYINGNGIDQVGLIAEEVNEHIPELVPKMEVEGFDEPQPNSVRYSQLSVFLLKAIQEQQTIIEDLKSRIETIEG